MLSSRLFFAFIIICFSLQTMALASKQTVCVVGATGMTGRHVVKMLLDQGHTVRTVVRSQERMKSILSSTQMEKNLEMTESSLLDMSASQLKEFVNGCDAIVSCLGHNLTFQGIWGHPRKLVTTAVERLSEAVLSIDGNKKVKFVLMGTILAENPNGKDDVRPFWERSFLSILRWLVPPHVDNEEAAAYFYNQHKLSGRLEWCVVRPDGLVDNEQTTPYTLYEKPPTRLFGGGTASRINVAHSMVELIEKEVLWTKWKFQMPVLDDDKPTEETK